jgi:hypothetical protein
MPSNSKPAYDIIGDIHGCSKTLTRLLEMLGYSTNHDGVYSHPERKVIFLGDFIDRGPFQREVITIVRGMIEAGTALSAMGNHEYNAIAFATIDQNTNRWLREHSDKNIKQHAEFLDAYAGNESEYREVIEWFKTLPLWLELEGVRVIHACWDKLLIEKLATPVLTEELLHLSSDKTQWQYEAIETILKGKEIALPEGYSFKDKDGNVRHQIRVQWWEQMADTYRKAFMGPETARTNIPDDEVTGDHLIEYSREELPVFLGHYWMDDDPKPLASNIACVDYSVAKPGGKLVAYRWSGETVLEKDHYVAVDRVE